MSKLGQRTGGKDAPILLCLDAREAAAAFLALDLTLKLSEEGVPEAEFPRPAIRCMQEIADAIVNDYPEASTIDFEEEEMEAEQRAVEAEQEWGKNWEDLTDEDLARLEPQNFAAEYPAGEELLDDEDEDEDDEEEEEGEIRYPAMKLPKAAVK